MPTTPRVVKHRGISFNHKDNNMDPAPVNVIMTPEESAKQAHQMAASMYCRFNATEIDPIEMANDAMPLFKPWRGHTKSELWATYAKVAGLTWNALRGMDEAVWDFPRTRAQYLHREDWQDTKRVDMQDWYCECPKCEYCDTNVPGTPCPICETPIVASQVEPR